MNLNVVSTRNLATRVNAGRVAQEIYDRDEQDMAVLETGNPEQPFIVERWARQVNVVNLISNDIQTIRDFLAMRT